MASRAKIVVTGDKAIDRALREIVSEHNAKGINQAFRKVARKAVREVVLPKVREQIPTASGFLKSQLRVRAVARSRSRIGYWVGFPDKLYRGDTFYGGFLEFGFKHRSGSKVDAESYLRKPLYENQKAVRKVILEGMRRWVRAGR